MTVAVSRAKGSGAEAVICASTGNTAASCAAYAARAGLRGAVIVPEGKIAIGKLAQALMHGARVVALRGNFDDALTDRPRAGPEAPDRARQLGQPAPDRRPEDRRLRGRRGARRGARRAGDPGRQRRQRHRLLARLPGARRRRRSSTASRPRARRRWSAASRSRNPETIASAIRIGNPARWEEAMAAFTASRGRVAAVSDEQIIDAYQLARLLRRRLLRARLGRLGRRPARPRPADRRGRAAAGERRLRAHRPRPQGPRHGLRQGARRDQLRQRPQRGRAGGVRLTARHRLVRVPASSANLGPGYDAMAAAVRCSWSWRSRRPGSSRSTRAGSRCRPAATTWSCGRSRRCTRPTGSPSGCAARSRWRGGWVERGGDRRRALRRRPPLRAGADARRSCWRGRPRSRAIPDNVAAAIYGGFVVCAAGEGRAVRGPLRPAGGARGDRRDPAR